MPAEADKRASVLPTVRIKSRTVTVDPPRPQGSPPPAEDAARALLRQTGKRKF